MDGGEDGWRWFGALECTVVGMEIGSWVKEYGI